LVQIVECRAHDTSTRSKTRKSNFVLTGHDHDEIPNVHHENIFVNVHNEGIAPGSTAAKGWTHNKASSFPVRGKGTATEGSRSVDNAVDEMAVDDDNFPSFDDALPCEEDAGDSNHNSHLGGA
jgi:hypothetical protein